MITLLIVLFVIVVVLLVPLILMQSGSGAQSGMLGSDFAMGVFGAKTNEVLVKITKWMVGTFFLLAFLIGFVYVRNERLARGREKAQKVEQSTQQEAPVESQNKEDNNLPLVPQK